MWACTCTSECEFAAGGRCQQFQQGRAKAQQQATINYYRCGSRHRGRPPPPPRHRYFTGPQQYRARMQTIRSAGLYLIKTPRRSLQKQASFPAKQPSQATAASTHTEHKTTTKSSPLFAAVGICHVGPGCQGCIYLLL